MSAVSQLLALKGRWSWRRFEHTAEHPEEVQRDLLQRILKSNQDTAYGRQHGFSRMNSVQDYQDGVPVGDYEAFRSWVDRLKEGERRVLTSEDPYLFALTSGTAGQPKFIPVNRLRRTYGQEPVATLALPVPGGPSQGARHEGVQSSVMALMASAGGFDRIPDCAIFADTRWEPPSIYEHLEWLSSHLTFPLYVVDNGRSLREDVKALTNHSGSRNYVDIPVYLKGHAGEGDGIGRRQCTDNYKIRPIRRRIRELLGLKPRQRVPNGTTVELWLGISTDEAIRMRTSRDSWITNRYPLIEAGMSRKDCADWWAARYDRPLERSACVACPFQSRKRWVETKRRWPELFAEAVEIDAKLRDGLALDKTPYLHSLRMPLAQAVAHDEAELGADGQRDGFGNECEGHCGV